MFLKKITILISLLFLSSVATAQTTTSTAGQFTFLKKGQEAPFEGTLFDPVATAKIIADKKFAREKCTLKTNYETGKLKTKCERDTKFLTAELEIEKKKFELIVEAQREEIHTLRGLAKGSDSTMWAAIGFLLGAGSSIAIFYAATEISK
tara:strand:+ start:2343 stop:2792 length:450 start_codon:yes stop_codon:yes gene_type:complete